MIRKAATLFPKEAATSFINAAGTCVPGVEMCLGPSHQTAVDAWQAPCVAGTGLWIAGTRACRDTDDAAGTRLLRMHTCLQQTSAGSLGIFDAV